MHLQIIKSLIDYIAYYAPRKEQTEHSRDVHYRSVDLRLRLCLLINNRLVSVSKQLIAIYTHELAFGKGMITFESSP